MSEELDRRIAIEVMGHSVPEEWPVKPGSYSDDGNWWVKEEDGMCTWQPLPFSTNLEYAMTAVDKYFEGWRQRNPNLNPSIVMDYVPDLESPWRTAEELGKEPYGFGHTLPEAICNLLLALKEEKE